MKILYLTPAWFGFDKMIYSGEIEVTGLPSFCYPLKSLVEKGYSVDMVVIYTDVERSVKISSDWVNKINILSFFKYELGIPKKLLSILKFRRLVKKLVNSTDYDFVYVHGSSPSVANDIILKKGIPVGQRLYGTFLFSKMQSQGVLRTKVRHIVEYLSFLTKKSFLLSTDDGSGADKVVDKIFGNGQPPYDFFHWKNGVSRLEVNSDFENEFIENRLPEGPFIFYCARFDAWKRQDRVVNILNLLKHESVSVKAVFAGPFDTLGDEYYNYVVKLAKQLNVFEQCVFLGSVSKQDIYLYNKYALVSLSLYDVCNVTSVFHEMMASSALIIVRDDCDVRDYIVNGESGFLVESDNDCVVLIKDILANPVTYGAIRSKVKEVSFDLTSDWEERASQEVSLIESYLKNGQG